MTINFSQIFFMFLKNESNRENKIFQIKILIFNTLSFMSIETNIINTIKKAKKNSLMFGIYFYI